MQTIFDRSNHKLGNNHNIPNISHQSLIMPTYIRHTFDRKSILAFILIAIFMPINYLHADIIELKNGRRIEGRIISNDGNQLLFRIQRSGVQMDARYSISDITNIQHQSLDKITYAAIPIVGPITNEPQNGPYVSADSFHQALTSASLAKPDYIILLIKSPGGMITEMESIINSIKETPQSQFIACIFEAHSAAAAIAMTCPNIFMAPNSQIGAAVPYIRRSQTPQNIEEKFQSIIRAIYRNAASIGGHSPLFIRGMSEPDIELAITIHGDVKNLVEVKPETQRTNLYIIKPKGKILTLTANEAFDYGLTKATVSSMDEIRQHMGISSWIQVATHATNHIQERHRSQQRQAAVAQEEYLRHMAYEQAVHARQVQIDKTRPELVSIESKISSLHAQIAASNIASSELQEQRDHELQSLETEHRKTLNEYLRHSGNLRILRSNYDLNRSQIISRYENELTRIGEIRNKSIIEIGLLNQRKDTINRSIPEMPKMKF